MESNGYESGDSVKVRTHKENFSGVLLESPESGIVLLKLSSGYNIGIKKEDIAEIELVKRRKDEKIEAEKRIEKNLPRVDIIITGGTISSKYDSKTGAVSSITEPSELLKYYPELFEIVNVRKIVVPFMKFSENMDSEDWKEIAKACEKSLNDSSVSGVILTHGTDFLHYTASALSFFLQNLNKPVVLTYAQRSADRASSDASLNLQCAARLAVSDIAEVMICGHSSMNDDFCYALPGTKTRKMHTSRRDAFKPINSAAIAKVFPDRVEFLSNHKKKNSGKVKLDLSFDERVALVKFYPGMDAEVLESFSRYSGLIIEFAGIGQIAGEGARKDLIPTIRKMIANGTVVCAAPQTIHGRLDPYVYSPGREFLRAGVIFLEDMLPETAYVKLGWVLAHRAWKDKIQEKMLENFSGELNSRLEE